MAPITEPAEAPLDADVKEQQERLTDLLGGLPPGGKRTDPDWGDARAFREFFVTVVKASSATADDAAQSKTEHSGPTAS